MIGPMKLFIPPVESGLIGRSDEHRTQTTLKRAGCFDDKKYFSSSYQDSTSET